MSEVRATARSWLFGLLLGALCWALIGLAVYWEAWR